MTRVVIASIPYVQTAHAPMAAPAVLKACLEQAGIACVAMDLNIDILVKTKSHYCKTQLEDFFSKEIIHDEAVEYISQILHYCANKILKENPTIIGLSLSMYHCQIFATWLCALLRELAPDCKIVIGGPGIKNGVSLEDNFVDRLKNLNLIDDYITGDGEHSIVEYAKGNSEYPGINTAFWDQNSVVLDNVPAADYSDYDFFWYESPWMPVVDAKGCVRSCEFCDVIEFWSKFKSKSAEATFNEMLHQYKKHNIRLFDFRSSLSNGNLKEFKKLVKLIADYNKTRYPQEQFYWNGSFIVRNAKAHPESLWEDIGASNGTLSLGVESVVRSVRSNLGKEFSNEDIDYHLEMAKKYNVKLNILIITGYATETLDDYEYTKQWFRDRKLYANNPIYRINLSILGIIPGTELSRKSNSIGIKFIGKDEWINTNLNITPEQRYQHYLEVIRICKEECGFNVQ